MSSSTATAFDHSHMDKSKERNDSNAILLDPADVEEILLNMKVEYEDPEDEKVDAKGPRVVASLMPPVWEAYSSYMRERWLQRDQPQSCLEVNDNLNANTSASIAMNPRPKYDPLEEVNMFLPPPNAEFYAANIYKPLDLNRPEIRLVRLLSANGSALQLEFTNSIFLNDPEEVVSYEALSYSAGDVRDTVPVTLNGHRFNIFRSLAFALSQIHASRNQAMWIDQICINQSDDAERGRQVQLMQVIYNRASNVLIWLGPQDNNSLGMLFAAQIYACYTCLERKAMQEPGCEFDDVAASERVGVWLTEILIGKKQYLADLDALFEIFTSSWWNRCWVVQEYIVALEATAIFGRSQMPFSALVEVAAILAMSVGNINTHVETHRSSYHGCDIEHVKKVQGIMSRTFSAGVRRMMHTYWHSSDHIPLHSLLSESRRLKSTDPRDRVYAMLGLASRDHGIIPSYHSSRRVEEVFISAAEACIRSERSLDVIVDAQVPSRRSALQSLQSLGHEIAMDLLERASHMSLPSWVPDFSSESGRASMLLPPYVKTILTPQGNYSASRDLAAHYHFMASTGKVGQVLRCRALPLGEVTKEWLATISDTESDVESWCNLALSRGEYVREDRMRVLKDTLAFGNVDGDKVMDTARYLHLVNEVWQAGLWTLWCDRIDTIGMVPSWTHPGDLVCVLIGASVPLVVRPATPNAGYTLVGPAYIHGFMHGEAIDEWEAMKLTDMVIDLY